MKVHKMTKNMVSMLSNLSIAMCHAFIKDQNLLPLLINLFDYLSNEQPDQPIVE
jgi:hypothetical protein